MKKKSVGFLSAANIIWGQVWKFEKHFMNMGMVK